MKLRIEIVQMGTTYFWALCNESGMLATSKNIAAKDEIEPEATTVAKELNLKVVINERG